MRPAQIAEHTHRYCFKVLNPGTSDYRVEPAVTLKLVPSVVPMQSLPEVLQFTGVLISQE